jgi:hypothetical protein
MGYHQTIETAADYQRWRAFPVKSAHLALIPTLGYHRLPASFHGGCFVLFRFELLMKPDSNVMNAAAISGCYARKQSSLSRRSWIGLRRFKQTGEL